MVDQMLIANIIGRQILDSRGNPTVEVDVLLDNGVMGRASVPSGASTGSFEAFELRDGKANYYMGKSVETAVNNVNTIIRKKLVGKNALNQAEIDKMLIELDGTPNKKNLGANAILGVSLAVAKASANALGLPLFNYIGGSKANIMPTPMMNVLNGGKHADNNLNIQEFMIVPVGAKTFSQAVRWCVEVFHTLKANLKKLGYATAVGDEGGFAPNFNCDEDAIKLIVNAIQCAGYKPYKDFMIAIDAAATEMKEAAKKIGHNNNYCFWKSNKEYTAVQLIEFWADLVKKYPIISIEDGLAEEDWNNWVLLSKKLKGVQLVGDDLFVTNIKRLQKGIKNNVANSILIKPNQIGTLTETLNAINLAHKNGYSAVVSHRSGETEDVTIADIAVATNCGMIKTGAPSRTDRVAKYNQLIRIELLLGKKAKYLGKKAFNTK